MNCNGTGKERCVHCSGVGRVGCHMCNGRGAVLRWIDVMAEFKTHSIVNVIERGGLNKEYLKLLEGRQMYKGVMFGGFMIRVQGWRLVEGDSFYDSEVNESIHDLLQQAEEVRMCFGTDR